VSADSDAPPARPVVAEDAFGQAEAAEDFGQMAANRGVSLVGASEQPERIAGVIVEDGERMAAARADGDVAFEVHLPEGIGGQVFKALEGPRLPGPRTEALVPTQDRGDGLAAGKWVCPTASKRARSLRPPQAGC